MELTEREKEALQQANHLNAIMSQSSIKEGTEAAHIRSQQQAKERLLRQKQLQDAADLEATLAFRQGEGGLDRAAAQQRASTMATNLTAGQRAQLGELNQSIDMVTGLGQDLEALPGNELGGLVGAGEWLLDTIGLDPLSEAYRQQFVSDDVQEWRGRAAAISSMAQQAYQKGVLSDQDFERVKAMDLSNPNLSKDQLRNRIGATAQIMGTARNSLAGQQQQQQPQPPQSGGRVVNFGDLK
jgi:hypothetical protein